MAPRFRARPARSQSSRICGTLSVNSARTSTHWVRPTLVVEVEYRPRLKDGLRHAAVKGFRPEKIPGLIRRFP
jgi:ATP-dependent DNA ligase